MQGSSVSYKYTPEIIHFYSSKVLRKIQINFTNALLYNYDRNMSRHIFVGRIHIPVPPSLLVSRNCRNDADQNYYYGYYKEKPASLCMFQQRHFPDWLYLMIHKAILYYNKIAWNTQENTQTSRFSRTQHRPHNRQDLQLSHADHNNATILVAGYREHCELSTKWTQLLLYKRNYCFIWCPFIPLGAMLVNP